MVFFAGASHFAAGMGAAGAPGSIYMQCPSHGCCTPFSGAATPQGTPQCSAAGSDLSILLYPHAFNFYGPVGAIPTAVNNIAPPFPACICHAPTKVPSGSGTLHPPLVNSRAGHPLPTYGSGCRIQMLLCPVGIGDAQLEASDGIHGAWCEAKKSITVSPRGGVSVHECVPWLSHQSPCQAVFPCRTAQHSTYPSTRRPNAHPKHPELSGMGVSWYPEGCLSGAGGLQLLFGPCNGWAINLSAAPPPQWQSSSRYLCWGFICNAV